MLRHVEMIITAVVLLMVVRGFSAQAQAALPPCRPDEICVRLVFMVSDALTTQQQDPGSMRTEAVSQTIQYLDSLQRFLNQHGIPVRFQASVIRFNGDSRYVLSPNSPNNGDPWFLLGDPAGDTIRTIRYNDLLADLRSECNPNCESGNDHMTALTYAQVALSHPSAFTGSSVSTLVFMLTDGVVCDRGENCSIGAGQPNFPLTALPTQTIPIPGLISTPPLGNARLTLLPLGTTFDGFPEIRGAWINALNPVASNGRIEIMSSSIPSTHPMLMGTLISLIDEALLPTLRRPENLQIVRYDGVGILYDEMGAGLPNNTLVLPALNTGINLFGRHTNPCNGGTGQVTISPLNTTNVFVTDCISNYANPSWTAQSATNTSSLSFLAAPGRDNLNDSVYLYVFTPTATSGIRAQLTAGVTPSVSAFSALQPVTELYPHEQLTLVLEFPSAVQAQLANLEVLIDICGDGTELDTCADNPPDQLPLLQPLSSGDTRFIYFAVVFSDNLEYEQVQIRYRLRNNGEVFHRDFVRLANTSSTAFSRSPLRVEEFHCINLDDPTYRALSGSGNGAVLPGDRLRCSFRLLGGQRPLPDSFSGGTVPGISVNWVQSDALVPANIPLLPPTEITEPAGLEYRTVDFMVYDAAATNQSVGVTFQPITRIRVDSLLPGDDGNTLLEIPVQEIVLDWSVQEEPEGGWSTDPDACYLQVEYAPPTTQNSWQRAAQMGITMQVSWVNSLGQSGNIGAEEGLDGTPECIQFKYFPHAQAVNLLVEFRRDETILYREELGTQSIPPLISP